MVQGSTPTSDTVCLGCELGRTFQPMAEQPRCNVVTVCAPGQRIGRTATNTQDTTCVECVQNETYQNISNSTDCHPVTPVAELNCTGAGSTHFLAPPTISADRECRKYRQCSFGAAQPGTKDSDIVCALTPKAQTTDVAKEAGIVDVTTTMPPSTDNAGTDTATRDVGTIVIVIVVFVLFVLLLALITGLLIWRRRHKHADTISDPTPTRVTVITNPAYSRRHGSSGGCDGLQGTGIELVGRARGDSVVAADRNGMLYTVPIGGGGLDEMYEPIDDNVRDPPPSYTAATRSGEDANGGSVYDSSYDTIERGLKIDMFGADGTGGPSASDYDQYATIEKGTTLSAPEVRSNVPRNGQHSQPEVESDEYGSIQHEANGAGMNSSDSFYEVMSAGDAVQASKVATSLADYGNNDFVYEELDGRDKGYKQPRENNDATRPVGLLNYENHENAPQEAYDLYEAVETRSPTQENGSGGGCASGAPSDLDDEYDMPALSSRNQSNHAAQPSAGMYLHEHENGQNEDAVGASYEVPLNRVYDSEVAQDAVPQVRANPMDVDLHNYGPAGAVPSKPSPNVQPVDAVDRMVYGKRSAPPLPAVNTQMSQYCGYGGVPHPERVKSRANKPQAVLAPSSDALPTIGAITTEAVGRNDAERALLASDVYDGKFLIRAGGAKHNPGVFVLSDIRSGLIVHNLIKPSKAGGFRLESVRYSNLDEIVLKCWEKTGRVRPRCGINRVTRKGSIYAGFEGVGDGDSEM